MQNFWFQTDKFNIVTILAKLTLLTENITKLCNYSKVLVVWVVTSLT
jgi:hypothetical protein